MGVDGESGLLFSKDWGGGEPQDLIINMNALPHVSDQLLRAVEAGSGVRLEGSGSGVKFDLAYLAPVIRVLRKLVINVGKVKIDHCRTLEDAHSLRDLRWQSALPDGDVDLARLPSLRSFSGHVHHQLESVLYNPSLTDLVLDGSDPARLPLIGAPLESLMIADWRSVDRVPQLRYPELLRSFRVDLPHQFDAASLSTAENLEKLQLNGVGRLENIAALAELSKLTRLEVEAASNEDWDVLLGSHAPSTVLILSPSPSKQLRDEGARRGWVVVGKQDQRSSRLAPFDLLDPWEEGGGPVLHLDDFAALANLLVATLGDDGLDDEVVNGHMVEDLVRAACTGDPQLSTVEIEFDSEAGGMYAVFPTKKLAQRAVTVTRTLIGDATRLRAVLGARAE